MGQHISGGKGQPLELTVTLAYQNGLRESELEMSTTPVEFHVSVTRENIRQGEPANGQSCPVALALWQRYSIPYTDTVLQIQNVTVGSESIDLTAGGYEFVADVPENIQHWIDVFDENDPDEYELLPVEFDLKFYCTNIDEDEEVLF